MTLPDALIGVRPEALVLDVDGVLTDNSILLDASGTETKRFHVPDGSGLRWLLSQGVRVAFLSGRASAATERRAAELGVEDVFTGIADKGPALESLVEKWGVEMERVVYVGDDFVDLPAFSRVGIPVAVPNAHAAVLDRAAAVTRRAGGEGAVREVCEWILTARGEYEEVIARFVG